MVPYEGSDFTNYTRTWASYRNHPHLTRGSEGWLERYHLYLLLEIRILWRCQSIVPYEGSDFINETRTCAYLLFNYFKQGHIFHIRRFLDLGLSSRWLSPSLKFLSHTFVDSSLISVSYALALGPFVHR